MGYVIQLFLKTEEGDKIKATRVRVSANTHKVTTED